MRRYYLNETLQVDFEVVLRGEIFHHVFDVCRQQVGHQFELMNADGQAFLTEVIEIRKKEALVKILKKRLLSRPGKPFINLIVSVPKISTFENILEKSVELGVNSIQPVVSDYSFVKSIKHYPKDKKSRWEKIILQATQQSGRGNLLKLHDIVQLNQIYEFPPWKKPDALGVFAYEGICEISFKNYLKQVKKDNVGELENIWVLVGSEGGFSVQEVQKLKELDLKPVTLGEQVLRVETACLAIISSLKYEFDLL